MIGIIRIVGLCGVLSAGIVAAYAVPQGTDPHPKTFTDRVASAAGLGATGGASAPGGIALHPAAASSPEARPLAGRGDRLGSKTGACAGQAWPYIAHECLASADGNPVRRPTRTITVERREGANTSSLTRMPVAEMASR
jgi:hypothetical protein